MLNNFERYFENNNEFETEYVKVLYYDLKKNYTGTYKSYDYNRVCTITEGIKKVRINNGQTFEYSTSEFILLPPNSSVDMKIATDTKAIVYEISNKLLEDTKEHIQNKFDLEVLEEDENNINAHKLDSIVFPIRRINDFLTSKEKESTFLVDLYSQELAYTLMKSRLITENFHSELHDPIQFTIQLFKKNITGNLSVQEIAGQLNMSTSNLSYRFKKQTGFTPKEYYNLLKLKKSREYLTSKTVSEVCYLLGFENISYFIALFKKYYGETPKQYSMRLRV